MEWGNRFLVIKDEMKNCVPTCQLEKIYRLQENIEAFIVKHIPCYFNLGEAVEIMLANKDKLSQVPVWKDLPDENEDVTKELHDVPWCYTNIWHLIYMCTICLTCWNAFKVICCFFFGKRKNPKKLQLLKHMWFISSSPLLV